MIREKMDFEHDELVTCTPIAGAVSKKMSGHGHLGIISLKNEHPSCSLFITLPVGGIKNREIFKVVACFSNQKIQTGTRLELLVSFCC
jgi:hypothetical protein